MVDFIKTMGRKWIGASMASGTILSGFVFVALTGKGIQSFAEFVNGIVMVYGLFAGGNAAATWATAKIAEKTASKANPPAKSAPKGPPKKSSDDPEGEGNGDA